MIIYLVLMAPLRPVELHRYDTDSYCDTPPLLPTGSRGEVSENIMLHLASEKECISRIRKKTKHLNQPMNIPTLNNQSLSLYPNGFLF